MSGTASKLVELVSYGNILESVRISSIDIEESVDRPVLIRILYVPINFADSRRVRGHGIVRQDLPTVFGGGEGVCVVERLHESYINPQQLHHEHNDNHGDQSHNHNHQRRLSVGDVCVMPMGCIWSQYVAVTPEELIIMPSDIDAKQLSMFGINVISAAMILKESGLHAGDWFIQNAVLNTIGKLMIAFGKRLGLKSVCVVSRDDEIEAVNALGADVVLVDGSHLHERVSRATNGALIRVAFDGLAGSSSGRLVETLAFGGKLLVYGLRSDPTMVLPANRIAHHGITIGGFSRMDHIRRMKKEDVSMMVAEVGDWHKEGVFSLDVEGVYPIDNVAAALIACEQPKKGKILLEF